jgi:hypothetical protein
VNRLHRDEDWAKKAKGAAEKAVPFDLLAAHDHRAKNQSVLKSVTSVQLANYELPKKTASRT